jgi:hypothetical protein
VEEGKLMETFSVLDLQLILHDELASPLQEILDNNFNSETWNGTWISGSQYVYRYITYLQHKLVKYIRRNANICLRRNDTKCVNHNSRWQERVMSFSMAIGKALSGTVFFCLRSFTVEAEKNQLGRNKYTVCYNQNG